MNNVRFLPTTASYVEMTEIMCTLILEDANTKLEVLRNCACNTCFKPGKLRWPSVQSTFGESQLFSSKVVSDY